MKITIVRTGVGATITVVANDHVYSEDYNSWDQALGDVVALNAWTDNLARTVPEATPGQHLCLE